MCLLLSLSLLWSVLPSSFSLQMNELLFVCLFYLLSLLNGSSSTMGQSLLTQSIPFGFVFFSVFLFFVAEIFHFPIVWCKHWKWNQSENFRCLFVSFHLFSSLLFVLHFFLLFICETSEKPFNKHTDEWNEVCILLLFLSVWFGIAIHWTHQSDVERLCTCVFFFIIFIFILFSYSKIQQ